MRLVQLRHPIRGRKIALVQEPDLIIINGFSSIFEMAVQAIENKVPLSKLIQHGLLNERLVYDLVYAGRSEWTLHPAFDHPFDPLHCMLSGTGLTHKASAENRQKMHIAQKKEDLTDSMKMYLWGLEGGRPTKGSIGIQPEWFYKGNGTNLRGHRDTLLTPPWADDGGEEPEVAGIYLNDKEGKPWRLGFTTSNEFSDHVMERKNYLYLAPSKIRTCSIGPELVLEHAFTNLKGSVSISRKGENIWEKSVKTGEENMAHSLENLEYHHFKYPNHRVPGQVHIHFFGADAFSFGEQVSLRDGDVMQVQWEGMGRALVNTLSISEAKESMISVNLIL